MGDRWRSVPLSEVTHRITKGTTPTTVRGSFCSSGISFVKVESITANGRIDVSRLAYIDTETDAILSRSRLQHDDILFTIAGTIGRVSLVDSAIIPGNTNQAVAIIRPDQSKIEPRFLYFALRDSSRINEAKTRVVQSVQANFSLSELSRLNVPLPSLKEQRAIAAILGAIDDKIELNRKMSATLEAMARAIFTSWFVDFDPVRAKAEGRDTGLAPEIATLFPDAFVAYADGEIPTNWSMHGLDDVATFLNGLALQRFPPRDGSPTLPVIKIAQLRAGHVKNADRADSSLKSDYVVTNGDILFSWSGSLECEIWVGGSGALNQHLFKVTGTVVPNWFAYLSVLHHLPSFRQIAAAKATTMGHIQRHHLHEATICIPSKPVFDAASALIGPMIEASWKRRLQSNTIATLRDTLLPKLISGEFRVSDAERILEMSA